jgi:hypothetical protein
MDFFEYVCVLHVLYSFVIQIANCAGSIQYRPLYHNLTIFRVFILKFL